MLTCAKQRGRDREHCLAFHCLNRNARGNPAVERDLDHVVCRRRLGCCRAQRGERRITVGSSTSRSRGHIVRLTQHFKRAGPVGQAADEPAFLKRRDQAVHARLRLEIERILHFLKRRRNPTLFETGLDETDQLVLLAGKHSGATPLCDACSCAVQ